VRLVRESGCRRYEKRNIEVVNMICDVLDEISPRQSGRYRDLITFVEDRPGHGQRYAFDC
jgi:dTDP-glucose 4,6-dehydratase